MNGTIKISLLMLSAILLTNCKNSSTESSEKSTEQKVITVQAPDFDSAQAFEKLKTQVEFGVRVPNTSGHKACGDWIVQNLKEYGLEVIEQPFEAFSYTGKRLNARNIIGAYKPEASKRIILAAHWDTREIADQDDERQKEPIPGANDGASGVAVLLQIAETISKASEKPDIGIDFIFFDAEDGGTPADFKGNSLNDYGGYLMGSEFWSKNLHKENYSAFYGILLDMVGANGATFMKDKVSMQVAPSVVNKVWNIAASKGFGSYFVPTQGGDIMDDHIPVIINTKIPMIDIIDQKKNGNQTFFDHWHTHDDNLSAINVNTLEAVGETVLQTVYQENGIVK